MEKKRPVTLDQSCQWHLVSQFTSTPFALLSWRKLQQFSLAGERLMAHNWLSMQYRAGMKPDTSIASPDRSPKPLVQAVDAIRFRRYALPKVRLLLEALKTGLALCSECHLLGSARSC